MAGLTSYRPLRGMLLAVPVVRLTSPALPPLTAAGLYRSDLGSGYHAWKGDARYGCQTVLVPMWGDDIAGSAGLSGGNAVAVP